MDLNTLVIYVAGGVVLMAAVYFLSTWVGTPVAWWVGQIYRRRRIKRTQATREAAKLSPWYRDPMEWTRKNKKRADK
jgi:hypothetical protein